MRLLEAAIKDLEMIGDCRTCGNKDPFCESNPDSCTGYKWRGAKDDNKPLTQEELREMGGEPVWISPVSRNGKILSRWMLVSGYFPDRDLYFFTPTANITQAYDGTLYRKTWLAYRRNPEEVK